MAEEVLLLLVGAIPVEAEDFAPRLLLVMAVDELLLFPEAEVLTSASTTPAALTTVERRLEPRRMARLMPSGLLKWPSAAVLPAPLAFPKAEAYG